MNYRHDKHFTIAEAIQSLYNHHSIIEKMQVLSQQLLSSGYDIRQHRSVPAKQTLPKEFTQLLDVIRKLESAGILVKDIEQGIVDFPHLRENGDEVYLCFKLGEELIQYWHSLDGGFISRQLLDQI
ncbi:MAG: hypothetical protein A2Y94_05440 [Caldithrix sp. RBG_13_44_9]|nr:MAG: hypothetical protein A2Y94_05440 [Caldithrix sp. RBG_13_44_9]